MRLRTRYLDVRASDLDDALGSDRAVLPREGAGVRRPARQRGRGPARAGPPRGPARRGHRPDLGPRPAQRLPPGRLDRRRVGGPAESDPPGVERGGPGLDGRRTSGPCWPCIAAGVPTFDYGNNIRQVAKDEGVADAFDFPGFVPAYIRPLFCRGIGPFRWAALSGDPEDIYKTDAKVKELMPARPAPAPLARHGPRADRVPGAAGPHLLGRPGRPAPARAGVQRDGRQRRAGGPGRDRARPPGFRLGGLARTARPRPWPTARTRCPTGRC